MARTIIKAEAFEEKTKEDMKALGVYKEEYNPMIKIYSKLLEQYEKLKSCIDLTKETKRTDAVITLEHLRTDIIKYSDALCLNPKSYLKAKIQEAPKKSKLESALELMKSG